MTGKTGRARTDRKGVVEGKSVAVGCGSSMKRKRREPLPLFVVKKLEDIYARAQLTRGCPDLVIWRTDRDQFRLVEVKCPEWDKPSDEQRRFIEVAYEIGVET